MKWASSLSSNDNIETCIEESCQAIINQLGDKPIHLTTIFVSPHFKKHYHLIPDLIRRRIAPGLLIGCSGGGIIGGGREVEQKPAFSITCAHLPNVEVLPIYSDTMSLPDQDTRPDVWRKWLGIPAEKNPHFIFLADPFSFRAEEFLTGVDFAYPDSKKLGGLASGARSPGDNVLYLETAIYKDGLVGIALSGDIVVDTIVAQGCRPIGKPLTITQCKQTLLQKVDGKTPMQILEDMMETLGDYDRQLMKTSLFLGIEMDPMKDEPKQGDFLIRNLMGVERESGAIGIGALLREGMLVQFHLRDKIMSAEDLALLLARYKSQGKSQGASGALLFSCLGRGEYLYGKPNHDSDLFKSQLGDVPLGGFFCNGEIGPVGQTTFLHGYTSSFAIFKSRSSQTL